MGTINDNLQINGHLSSTTMDIPAGSVTDTSVSATAAIARSKLAQDTLKPYAVPLLGGRVWDAIQTALPAPTPANDDLGVTVGTWGTNPVYLSTGDVKNTTTKTQYAVYEIPLPAEYVDAETVVIRVKAGMQTTVCSGAATVDLEVYEATGASATGISADLCATAAQDIKNLTAADKDFTITATDLVAGDMLNVRVAVAVADVGTGTAVIANVYSIKLLCDVKG